jgi:hypothetical protein
VFVSAPVAALPSIRAKGLQLTGLSGQFTSWEVLFTNGQWTAGNQMKAQIDLAIGLGANAVKITAPLGSFVTGGSTQATATTNMKVMLDYVAAAGLQFYWNLSIYSQLVSATNAPIAGAAMSGILAVLNQYPNVFAVDVINEINFGQTMATAKAWMDGLTNQVRAATSKPISYSLSVQSAFDFGGVWPEFSAAYVDYQDFHMYYTTANPVADVTNHYFADAAANPRPYFVGESGLSAANGQSAQSARWDCAGKLAADSRSRGAIGFTTVDFGGASTGDYGIYESDLTTERTWLATSFSAWPSS